MAKDFESLKQQALVIKNEVEDGANNTERVGGILEDIVESMKLGTTEFNVSAFFPTGGTNGSNKYDLASAIGKVPAELRTDGLTVSFLNESGDTEKWEFSGGSWAVGSFEQVGPKRFTKLDNKIDNLESQKLNKSESPQKDTEEDGAFFTDELGNVFMQYLKDEGFDVAKISKSFLAKISSVISAVVDTEEDGAFLCNEKGEVFARYVNGKFEAVGIGNTIIPTGPSNKSKYDNIRKDELNEEEELILSDIPDCKNYYTIGACIGITNMGTIELCKGQKDYSKGDILIDSVNITEIRDGGSTNVIPHGLTITESIIVTIIKKTSTTKINIINADGKSFSGELKYFNGCQGREIKMIAKNGNYKNVSLCFSGTWFLKDTWVFGNSYTDFWPKIAYELGFENFGLDGYSGRTSLSALESLKLEIKYGLPKKVVWMMGMNDPDSEDSVNQNWKKAFEDAMEICETNSIQFIPCTIPNVPERIHTYKNSVIRESGLQYIDIASAVGANEKGSGWYDGLLGNDNVHPTNIEGSTVITYALAAGVSSITQ